MSGYAGGGGYGDMGLGLAAEFRPVEAVGLELAWMHHSETWDDNSERTNDPLQASVNLYAFPWTRVSPYFSAGLTWNGRQISDEYFNGRTLEYQVVDTSDTLFGPHAGVGVEFAIGDSAALNFEAQYIGYIDVDDTDASAPSATQGTMGMNFYF